MLIAVAAVLGAVLCGFARAGKVYTLWNRDAASPVDENLVSFALLQATLAESF